MNHFQYLCNMFHLEQLVQQPTRVAPTGKTLIGVILNMSRKHKNTSVINVTLSDHFLFRTDVVSKVSFKTNVILCRSSKGFNKK